MAGRIDMIEVRLRHLEEDAARAQAAERKQMEEDLVQARIHSKMWFTAFKIAAIAQIVFAVAAVICRSW